MFSKLIKLVLFTLLFVGFVSAGDLYDQDALTINPQIDGVYIAFDVTAGSADTEGSKHSRPIFIGNCNDVDAYLHVICNAAADFNIVIHYSMDLTNWVSVTKGDLDACSNTLKHDTLGVGDTNFARFHEYSWMVIEVDAQSGVDATDICYVRMFLQADFDLVTSSGKVVPYVYTSNNVTDP